MLPLSANPDFKDATVTREDPYRDINGENMSTKIEIYGADALDQAIEAVIVTEPYERLFNIGFYSPFYRLLFENENMVDTIMQEVYDKIESYVDILIVREGCKVNVDTANHSVSFMLPYLFEHNLKYHIFSRVISA